MLHDIMPDLYECVNELAWIKPIIYDFNKLGFMTVTSQPGTSVNNCKVYKSLYDRKYNIKQNIITTLGCRKQRAYIRGYMKSDMADYIVEILAGDEYLFVRSSNHNKILDDPIKLGSVMFINDQPVAYEMSNLTDIRYIPDSDESFDFALPLRRSVQDKDIAEIDILDRQWNNNDLWKILYDIIKEYSITS